MRRTATAFLRGLGIGLTLAGLVGCVDQPPEAERLAGQDLASSLCAGCHAIGPTGASPLPAAPVFRELVHRWQPEELAEALAEGIAVGHGAGVEMPVFAFQPEEIDAFLAFLEDLRRR